MRKNLLTVLLFIGASVASSYHSNAQSTLLYYWNFNNFASTVTLPAIASLAADYAAPGKDTAKARWIYKPKAGTSSSYSSYCDNVTGDTTNARMGQPAGNGFRARNPNDSMDILVYMPTTHFTNLTIKYACELSSYTSGDSVNVYSYSIDSGATWITSGTGLSEWVDSGYLFFKLISVHVNDIAASNNPKFVFRINTAGRNSTSGGNNRFDNVTLDADSIILSLGVTNVNATAPAYSLFPNPVKSEINISSNLEGNKTIIITNIIGKTVLTENKEGRNFAVKTDALLSGVYYITIRENESGNISTLKFIKE